MSFSASLRESFFAGDGVRSPVARNATRNPARGDARAGMNSPRYRAAPDESGFIAVAGSQAGFIRRRSIARRLIAGRAAQNATLAKGGPLQRWRRSFSSPQTAQRDAQIVLSALWPPARSYPHRQGAERTRKRLRVLGASRK